MSSKILVLDIETTGFFNQGGSIIEIGIVELDLETGEAQIIFDSLLKEETLNDTHFSPPMGWIFDNSDLTKEAVMNAPPAEDVLSQVQEVIDKYPLGVTAYNKKFDFTFLIDRGITLKSLPCPMMVAMDVLKMPNPYGYANYKWPKVQEAYDFLFPDNGYVEKHRGADDALHEAEIVYALYKLGEFKLDQ